MMKKLTSLSALFFTLFLSTMGTLLYAKNNDNSTTALFGAVTGVRSNDTLNVRAQPNYHAKKIGKLPPDARIGVDRCIQLDKSRWCRIHHLAQYDYEDYGANAPDGWVNARYLKFYNQGYVLIDGKGNCDYVLGCKKNVCQQVTDIKTDTKGEIVSLRTQAISRKRLKGASHFGAAADTGGDGYCTDGNYIQDFLRTHPNYLSASKNTARARANAFLKALQNHSNPRQLLALVHPKKGIIASAHVYFGKNDVHISHHDFANLNKIGKKQRFWGEDDAKGEAIRMSLNDFLSSLVQSRTPTKVKQLKEFKGFKSHGIATIGYEYYWINAHSKTKDYDWQGLVILLQQHKGKWYVVGILRDRWTI